MTKVFSGLRASLGTKSTTYSILASMAVCTGATLAIGLAPAPVQAQIVLDQTIGTWINPVGGFGVNTQTVGLQNQIFWGTGSSGQSGLGFTGVGPAFGPVFPGTDFLLGTLQHFNNPINSGTAMSSVTLNLETIFSTPMVSVDFLYTTAVNETPNVLPCEFPSTVPCADEITITNAPSESFAFGGKTFTLSTFFLDGGGNPTNSLISQEQGTTTAQLFGRLVEIPGPGPSEVPGPLPVLGIAAAFGYSRKLRKRIQAS